MSYYQPLTCIVAEEQDGWILKTVLRGKMGISRKLLSRVKLTESGITVNGVRRYVNTVVRAGDRIEVRMEEETSEDILPEDLPLDILYEDEHLLILNKPAGMIVHPTHGHYTGTLANAVMHHWRQRGVEHRFRPVHRLDQETSGVLAVAKHAYAHQQLAVQMEAGTIDKRYIALVLGRPPAPSGTIDAPIDRDSDEPARRVVRPDGYPSVTVYETLAASDRGACLGIRLLTGRTHQIRVHMAHIGCPLLGDKMYGSPGNAASVQADRQALHAQRLTLDHPIDGGRLCFHAPIPEDMRGWSRQLLGQASAEFLKEDNHSWH